MSLRTYDRPRGLHGNLLPWPFFVDNDKTDSCFEHTFAPGDHVIHKTLAGRGMIVGINDEQMIVLWSIEPKIDFDNIMSLLMKRVTSQLIANQITQVQPMNLPSPGMTFYLDYTYGKDYELDKRCNEGPWLDRMYWRARRFVRCSKTRVQSSLSSLSRWLRSAWRSRRDNTSNDDANYEKKLLEKWTRPGLIPPPSGAHGKDQSCPQEPLEKTRGGRGILSTSTSSGQATVKDTSGV